MEENTSLFEQHLDEPSAIEMTETARWARMFGLVMITLMGISVLFFVFAWGKLQALFVTLSEGEQSQSMIIILVALLFCVALVSTMCFFLVRGANRIKTSLQTRDQQQFNSGLVDIKTYFIFYGVIAILGLLVTLVSFIN